MRVERVERVTAIYEVASDHRGKQQQDLMTRIGFAEILNQHYSKSDKGKSIEKTAPDNEGLKDKYIAQNHQAHNAYLGLYNGSARVYLESIMGTYHTSAIMPAAAASNKNNFVVEAINESEKSK